MQARAIHRFCNEVRESSWLDGHGGVAAVDDQFVAVDEGAGAVGGEEEGGADEFVGVAEAGGGGVAHDGGDTVFGEDFAILFGGEEAGDEGVDADADWGPFAGEVLAEVVHGGLRHGVGEDPAERGEAGHGAEVDDGGGDFVFDEVATEDLAGEDDGFGVDVHDAVILFLGDVEEGRGGVDASSVDEDVALAGAFDDLVEEELEVGGFGGICGDEVAGAAGAVDGVEAFFGFGGVASDEDDFGSGGGVAFGDGAAEFTGAADDDGGFALEGEEFENRRHGDF